MTLYFLEKSILTFFNQEVEGVVNGTRDYSLLRGDTGPLVYPAVCKHCPLIGQYWSRDLNAVL